MKHDNFEADYTNWSKQVELLNQKLSPTLPADYLAGVEFEKKRRHKQTPPMWRHR